MANESLVIHLLRGMAAYMVVIFHSRVDLWQGWRVVGQSEQAGGFARLMALFSIPAAFGGAGVMLFFVLSGYCIALPYAGSKRRPFRYREYFIRRFFRIYPPYLAVIVLCGIITMLGLALDVPSLSDVRGYWQSVFLVQNYTTGQIALNSSLWSLPVEMELYLVFPLFYFGLRRLGEKWMWSFSLIVSATGMGLYSMGWTAATLNFAKFWLIWWSGAMLAEWKQGGCLQKPNRWFILVGIFALAYAVFGTIKGWNPAWLHFPYAYIFFVVLWLMLAGEEIVEPMLRKVAPGVVAAGTISYSLYLVHFPLFRLFGTWWVSAMGSKPVNFLWALLAVIPATLFAWLFYKVVEQPSHKWAKRLSRESIGK